MKNLPTKLKKEPLIDAVFELRFTSLLPASEILPGFLFGKLTGNKSIAPLPAAQIPKELRDADPNLRFTPVSRLDWNDFFINVSDHSISIGCKLPYPGWVKFKNAIILILDILKEREINFIQSLERYSVKYVDLISSTDLSQQISFLNLDIIVANHQLKKEAFQLRIEIPKDNFINIINLVSFAKVKLMNDTIKEGIIVDVDTISNLDNISLQNFFDGFPDKLEIIHHTNKSAFFSCLKAETIESLEPIYE